MSAFIATIPPNVRPGQQFAAILNGEKRVFVCPPGTGSGSKVQVLVPAPAISPANKKNSNNNINGGVAPGATPSPSELHEGSPGGVGKKN